MVHRGHRFFRRSESRSSPPTLIRSSRVTGKAEVTPKMGLGKDGDHPGTSSIRDPAATIRTHSGDVVDPVSALNLLHPGKLSVIICSTPPCFLTSSFRLFLRWLAANRRPSSGNSWQTAPPASPVRHPDLGRLWHIRDRLELSQEESHRTSTSSTRMGADGCITNPFSDANLVHMVLRAAAVHDRRMTAIVRRASCAISGEQICLRHLRNGRSKRPQRRMLESSSSSWGMLQVLARPTICSAKPYADINAAKMSWWASLRRTEEKALSNSLNSLRDFPEKSSNTRARSLRRWMSMPFWSASPKLFWWTNSHIPMSCAANTRNDMRTSWRFWKQRSTYFPR